MPGDKGKQLEQGAGAEELVFLPALAYRPGEEKERGQGDRCKEQQHEQDKKKEELVFLPARAYRPGEKREQSNKGDDGKELQGAGSEELVLLPALAYRPGEENDRSDRSVGKATSKSQPGGSPAAVVESRTDAPHTSSPDAPVWPYPLFDPRGRSHSRQTSPVTSAGAWSSSQDTVKHASPDTIDVPASDKAGIGESQDATQNVKYAPDELVFTFTPDEVEGWYDEEYSDEDERQAVNDDSASKASWSEWFADQESRQISPDSIPIYLDTDAMLESEISGPRVELVFMKPTGLDTSLLDNIREEDAGKRHGKDGVAAAEEDGTDISLDGEIQQQPLARHIDDLNAVEKLLTHRQKKWGVDDSGLFQRDGDFSRHLRTYRGLLRDIVHHNHTHPPPGSSTATAFIGSNQYLTALWIRERMQAKWEVHNRHHSALRAVHKARVHAAEVRNDHTSATEKEEVAKEQRLLTRQLFEECVVNELRDVEGVLAGELAGGLAELRELFALRNAVRLELFDNGAPLSDLLDQSLQLNRSSSPPVSSTPSPFPYLFDQIDALSSLISIGLHTTATLETRLNRLAAKDVRDPKERRDISNQRLSQPEALSYLNKAAEDLQFVRDWSRTVIAGFQGAEGELDALARDTGGWYSGLKECLVWLERRADDDGFGN